MNKTLELTVDVSRDGADVRVGETNNGVDCFSLSPVEAYVLASKLIIEANGIVGRGPYMIGLQSNG